MAKQGSGDPRWIVEDRPDGKNVNDWHWAEKDVTQKAKEVLASILETSTSKFAEITSIKDISGEATLINRKKKKSLVYELSAKVTWKGQWDQIPINGTVTFVEIADEVRDDEIDIKISFGKGSLSKEQAKEAKNSLTRHFRSLVTEFQDRVLEVHEIQASKPVVTTNTDPPAKPQPAPTEKKPAGNSVLPILILGIGVVLGIGGFYLYGKRKI